MGDKSDLTFLQRSQGDLPVSRKYYKYVITKMIDRRNILNLGSGSHFEFERQVKERLCREGIDVEITSLDSYPLEVIPEGIKYVQSEISEASTNSRLNRTFDCITCFETIEHLEDTDSLLELVRTLLSPPLANGLLVISFPNLSSIFCRLELLFGFQPHVLEVSNRIGPLGMGLMGRFNYSNQKQAIHHIRGITLRAMREFLQNNNFEILETRGFADSLPFWPKRMRSLAPTVVIVCRLSSNSS